jgi:hypothetical protein
MKLPNLVPTCIALTLLAFVISAFQRPTATPIGTPAGQITTLYASDPIESSLDLRTGRSGLVVQDGEVRNRDSHVCLGYAPDSLAVAIQGGDRGAIVDLGTLEATQPSSGTTRVGNGGNVFVALKLQAIRSHPALHETTGVATAPVVAGHVYVARIVNDREQELFFKLLVLEFRPGESVTFRWQLLEA